jgi:hypothetical protein
MMPRHAVTGSDTKTACAFGRESQGKSYEYRPWCEEWRKHAWDVVGFGSAVRREYGVPCMVCNRLTRRQSEASFELQLLPVHLCACWARLQVDADQACMHAE